MTSVNDMTDPAEEAARIRAAARDWLYRLNAGEDPDAEAHCAAWRAVDPRHEQAFQLARHSWALAGASRHAQDDSWRAEAAAFAPERGPEAAPRSLMRRAMAPLALAASIVAALLLLPLVLEKPDLSVHTQVAENRTLALSDGSRVTVGARSDIGVRFAPDTRKVVLDEGQAFFEVAHDPRRPFIVVAGKAEIHVTGTKFDVRRTGDDVQVAVLEGRVELRRRPPVPLALLRPEAPQRVLTAGERSELEDGDSFTPEQPTAVTPGAWREGRLFYADAPLSDIIADAARYSRVPIRIAEPRIAALQLTASYPAGQIDELIANVEQALPVRSQRADDGSIILTGR